MRVRWAPQGVPPDVIQNDESRPRWDPGVLERAEENHFHVSVQDLPLYLPELRDSKGSGRSSTCLSVSSGRVASVSSPFRKFFSYLSRPSLVSMLLA